MTESKMRETPSRIRKHEDEYTKAIGEIGRWQMFVFFMTAFPIKLVLPSVHFGIIFMAPKTTYRCVERENSTEKSVNMTCYSDCKKYEYYSDFESTITEQWDLICDRAWLADFAQTILMFGVLVGSVVFGFVSDRFGRRITLIFAGTLECCMSFVMPFCPDFWSFIGTRFLLGSSTGGTMMTSFVLLMEIFGPNKRDLLGSIYMMPLTLGHVVITIIAFYIRTWRGFSVGMAIPTLVYLTYVFFLPESPKWLISVGRLDEASAVMTKAAKWNKLPTSDMRAKVDNIVKQALSDKRSKRKATLIDLVKLPSLRIKNLCSCVMWFICGVSFYGTYQYFGQTSPNVFLSFVLVGLAQTPGFVISSYVSRAFGRRVAVSSFFIISGIGNGILALPDEWYYVKLVAGTIGAACGGAVFSLLYVYTTELFPTVARNMGIGTSSTANRIGSMLAPFVGGLRVNTAWLPPAVFAVLPIIGVVACWFLPETRGRKIEDNLDES